MSFPIVVAQWPKSERESIRVMLDEYRGHPTITIRTFYRDGSGVLKPGKGGVGMSLRHLPQLAEAINAALAKARGLGLVEPPEGDAR